MRFVKTAESIFGLPTGFQRAEYLESSGTQYIDTGVKAKTGLTVEARLKYTTNTGIFCGAITTAAGTGDRFYPINFAQSNKVAFTYLDSAFSASTSITNGSIYTIKTVLGSTKQEMFVDGVSKGSTSKTNVVEIDCTLGLFALHRGEAYDEKWVSQVPASLYYCKIWDGDTLVRDFIPCIDPLGVPCMYDLVGKKTYYNQGTGADFTVGRQIIPVEYIESTGTQYIDTGYKAVPATTKFEFYFSPTTITGNYFLFGARPDTSIGGLTCTTYFATGNIRQDWAGLGSYFPKINVDDKTLYSAYNNTVSLNNDSVTGTVTRSTDRLNYNFLLFTVNTGGTVDSRMYVGKVYYAKLWDDGTLVRDFIPCKDENNVGFMFDSVSGTVYLNAGTGAFVVGNNKYKMKLRLIKDNVLPTGYTQIEYIEAENSGMPEVQYAVGNYRLTNTTDWEITFSAENSNNSWVMGQPTWIGVHYRKDTTTGNLPRVGITNSSAAASQCYVDYTNNEKITLALKGTDVYANGVKVGSITRTSAPATQTQFGIFAYKDINQELPNLRIQSARIYRLKIWDNDVLVQDLVPAMKDGVAGFYERVTKTFIEKESNSTSDFTTGKPVLPVVRFPVDPVPVGYKTVNYLGSDSTAYIDTGVSGANDNLKIEMDFSYSKFYAYGYFFSNYESEQHNTTRFLLDASNNSRGLAYINTKSQNGAIYTPYNLTMNDKHNVIITKTTCSLDGVITTLQSPPAGTANTKNIILFNRGAGSYANTRDIGMRCFSFKIYDNNTLVRNFIPVIRLLDNKAGMWDTVTKQFYTTPVGDFITG